MAGVAFICAQLYKLYRMVNSGPVRRSIRVSALSGTIWLLTLRT